MTDVSRSRIGWARSFTLAAGIMLSAIGSASATDIVACGQTVAGRDTGVLQADLDCPSSPFGVRLLGHATLDLNSHRITGGESTFATVLGARVVNDADLEASGKGNFTIMGPGEISGVVTSRPFAIGTQGCVDLGNGRARITSATGTVDIHGCVFGVVGYLLEYSTSKARAKIDHVTLHDNLFEGVTVRKLEAANVTSHDNGGIGIHANSTMVVSDSEAHGNQIGVFATRRLMGTNIVATGNGNGAESFGSLMITNLDASNNTYLFGVSAVNVQLTDSTVTGNPLADIRSTNPPHLTNVTCGRSLKQPDNASWGVCTND